ncbi:MAG: AAA family ATPase, partial [Halobacteriota archaeon]|nr:AAA family ATPase [Halobacteriota archaeon]
MIKLLSIAAKGFKRLDLKLVFPERGNILITGMNESGKSTLFEAIYFSLFGTGLVPDKSHKSIRDLLSYESDICEVDLEFEINKMYYNVKRVIKRTKDDNRRYIHELKIQKPNGKEEVVKGSSVTKRIELELGLDGDAMLNSCFVEQKNLDKLETSKKSERRDSIAKLLNLEAFTEIERELRLTEKDLNEQRIYAEKRLNLARIATEIPKREERLRYLDHQLELIELLKEKRINENEIKGIEKRSEEITKDIFEIEQKITRLINRKKNIPEKENKLREFKVLLSILSKVLESNEKIRALSQREKELKAELTGLDELKAEVYSRKSSVRELESEEKKIQEREVFYRRLVSALDKRKELNEELKFNKMDHDRIIAAKKQCEKELSDLENINKRLAELSADSGALNKRDLELRSTLAIEESKDKDLRSRLLSIEKRQALSDWRGEKIRIDRLSDIEEEERRVREEKEEFERDINSQRVKRDSLGRSSATYFSGSILTVFLSIILAFLTGVVTYSLLPLLIAIFFLIRFISIMDETKRIKATIKSTEEAISRGEIDLARIEGEKKPSFTDSSESFERLNFRLGSLNLTVSSIEECDSLIDNLNLLLDREDEDELKNRIQSGIKVKNDYEKEIEVIKSRLKVNEADVLSLKDKIVNIDRENIFKTKKNLDDELMTLEGKISDIEGILMSIDDGIKKETENSHYEIRKGFEEVKNSSIENRAKIAQQIDEISRINTEIDKIDESSLCTDITSIEKEILEEREKEKKKVIEVDFRGKRLDIDPDYDNVLKMTSRLEEEIRNDKTILNEIDELKESKKYKLGLLDKLKEDIISLKKDKERIDVAIFSEESIPDTKDEKRLISLKEGALGELGSLTRKKNELMGELGLKEDPDVKKSEKVLIKLEEECLIHDSAMSIVTNARSSIMSKVLPATEANMTKFLPILTAGNYKDAKINKESYQIEVYDDVAGEYRPKSVFSGGAKDQFSLALRLSFAMATLPQERGAVPGFIFLDEPIGS